FTDSFTNATHFFLGLALAVAPVAAWIAQRAELAVPPLTLAFGVMCWVAGFDLIYATQDYEFDKQARLHSLVVKLGIPRSLHLAQLLHLIALAALIGFGLVARLGPVYFCGTGVVAAALWIEHRAAGRLDVAAINRAFFASNAFVSATFLVAVCVDRLVAR
ncbi:MAG: UbiA family prenyltransferase, partial [Chthoniobacterales bacterium]